jgi:peptidoglycan-associated lipoprotein
VDLGISASRLSTISYGEERPLDNRDTEEAWAKNRRGQFKLK